MNHELGKGESVYMITIDERYFISTGVNGYQAVNRLAASGEIDNHECKGEMLLTVDSKHVFMANSKVYWFKTQFNIRTL